jgi:RHS repeat-associated protein
VPLAITRDGDGFPVEIGPFTLTRDGPGARPTLITDGTGSLTLGYDAFDRLSTRNLTVGGVTVYDATYEWNTAGRLVGKTEAIGGGAPVVHEYAYDVDSQLELVTEDSTPVERYTYDVRGNRASRQLNEGMTQLATYDTQDRLQSQGGVTYVVDTDGFLAARGSATFVHGARGDLLEATSGGTTVSYAYDALGRRVARTVGTARTEYLYGSPEHELQVTAVRASDGTLTLHHWDDGGRLLAIERGAERWWVATDHLGSPRVVSDAAGTIVKRLEYDAWGNVTLDSAPGFDLAVGWAGGLPDPTTGLVRFGLRDYDPQSGRWATRDQALLDGRQANLYAYVRNDPASATDPGGLWSIEASAYDGIGGGLKFQKTKDGIAICSEIGFGVGEEIEFEPSKEDEELERDRNVTAAKLSLGAGPFTELELSSEFEECDGELQAKPKVKGCWLAVCQDGSGDRSAHTDPGQGHKPDLGPKLEGKLAAKFCQQARW